MGAPPGQDAVDLKVDTANIDPRILGHMFSEQPNPLPAGLRSGDAGMHPAEPRGGPVTLLLSTSEFWDARPSLRHILDFARARRVGPWASSGRSLSG